MFSFWSSCLVNGNIIISKSVKSLVSIIDVTTFYDYLQSEITTLLEEACNEAGGLASMVIR